MPSLNRLRDIFRLNDEIGCGLWRAYLELSELEGEAGYHDYYYQHAAEKLHDLGSNEPGVARQAMGLSRASKEAFVLNQNLVHYYNDEDGYCFPGWLVDVRNLEAKLSHSPGTALMDLLGVWNQKGPRIENFTYREDAVTRIAHNVSRDFSATYNNYTDERRFASLFTNTFGDRARFWKIENAFEDSGYDETRAIGAEGSGLVGFIMTTCTL